MDGSYYAGSPTYSAPAMSYGTQPSTTTSMPAASAPTPADSVPAIQGVNPQSMQRPVLEQLQATPAGSTYYPPAATPNINLQTSTSTVVPAVASTREVTRQAWSYSPVRLASFEESTDQPAQPAPVVAPQQVIKGEWQLKPQGKSASEINAAWKTVNW
jgi:hypothetical protein